VVERLKDAIEKAARERAAMTSPHPGPAPSTQIAPPASNPFLTLPEVALDNEALVRERVIARDKSDPRHAPFDILRTRLLRLCRENGWRKIGVTSPTQGCGKSVIVANLSMSLSRYSSLRTVTIDMDLRAPHLGKRLGLNVETDMVSVLRGETRPSDVMVRVGENLAILLNNRAIRDAAEVIHNPACAAAIDNIDRTLQPDIMLFDLAPMLVNDDVAALLPQLDGVLVVAAAGATTASEIEMCERDIEGNTVFLGIVLNKSSETQDYSHYESHGSTAD
jgi:protein-tyrosine kinase